MDVFGFSIDFGIDTTGNGNGSGNGSGKPGCNGSCGDSFDRGTWLASSGDWRADAMAELDPRGHSVFGWGLRVAAAAGAFWGARTVWRML